MTLKQNKKPPLYIFLHITKCGGTTITHHIRENLKNDEYIELYEIYKEGDTKWMDFDYQTIEKSLSATLHNRDKNKIKIIFGHQAYYGIHKFFPGRDVRYTIFLRNHANRMISQYNYRIMGIKGDRPISACNRDVFNKKIMENGTIVPFERWVENGHGNFLNTFLYKFYYHKEPQSNETVLEKNRDILNKFYFVGIVENPDDFLFFYNKLGIKKFFPNQNVSKKYFVPSNYNTTKKLILYHHNEDQKLYEYGTELNQNFKKTHNIKITPKPLYIFLHIHKCAGSTLKGNLIENLLSDEILTLYYDENKKLTTKTEVNNYIRSLGETQKEKIKAIIGHQAYYGIHKLFPGREVRYVTFLREPINRVISQYNFHRMQLKNNKILDIYKPYIYQNNKILEFDEWFKHPWQHNFVAKFLYARFFSEDIFKLPHDKYINQESVEKIKDILNKFHFIGSANNKNIAYILHELGVKYIIPNQNISDKYLKRKDYQKFRKSILSQNQYDKSIYHHALDLNRKIKNKNRRVILYSTATLYYKKFAFYVMEWNKRIDWLGRLNQFYGFCRLVIYKFVSLPIFKLSAVLKDKSKTYERVIKLIKNE